MVHKDVSTLEQTYKTQAQLTIELDPHIYLSDERTQAEVHKALQVMMHLGVTTTNGSVLDLCCGIGRHTPLLAQALVDSTVYGIDFSADLLALHETYIGKPSGNMHLVTGDVTALPSWIPKAQSAFCIGNSFMLLDALTNVQMVVGVARSLVSGAGFVFDRVNADAIIASMSEKEVVIEQKDISTTTFGVVHVTKTKELVAVSGGVSVLHCGKYVVDARGTQMMGTEFDILLYQQHHLEQMLVAAGFEVVVFENGFESTHGDSNAEMTKSRYWVGAKKK